MARALPPFNPPLRLSAFFPVSSGVGSISPVACRTMSKATWLKSLRLFVLVVMPNMITQPSREGYIDKFQTEPLPKSAKASQCQ